MFQHRVSPPSFLVTIQHWVNIQHLPMNQSMCSTHILIFTVKQPPWSDLWWKCSQGSLWIEGLFTLPKVTFADLLPHWLSVWSENDRWPKRHALLTVNKITHFSGLEHCWNLNTQQNIEQSCYSRGNVSHYILQVRKILWPKQNTVKLWTGLKRKYVNLKKKKKKKEQFKILCSKLVSWMSVKLATYPTPSERKALASVEHIYFVKWHHLRKSVRLSDLAELHCGVTKGLIQRENRLWWV